MIIMESQLEAGGSGAGVRDVNETPRLDQLVTFLETALMKWPH